ncbi:biliverdin-producing heme oxygenase [Lichenifustis flavocetrariae]|uniref:Biliverdin-producing heme oxygenase n=1 Tax=Lichenifustis flavocetrariae TaxID=2949735 RepID=A0AA41YT10_9HYPH|nr:biliverdin-producing heme oxygenase [Lichenifustis flavocetrariae]MCW6508046.1 biliverdin-producing heme oxygenase [Lichenifustis flavocetrariae]
MTSGLSSSSSAGRDQAESENAIQDTPHAALRRDTRAWHDRVEAGFAPFDLQQIDGLTGFLRRQAMAVLPLEHELDRMGICDLVPDWPQRRRGDALLADLEQLGSARPAPTAAIVLPSRLHALGALYVLEGSRLGGRVLARRVASSPDPRVRTAVRFLTHRLDKGWSTFLATLDAVPPTSAKLACLRDGATKAFSLFDTAPDEIAPRSGLVHFDNA